MSTLGKRRYAAGPSQSRKRARARSMSYATASAAPRTGGYIDIENKFIDYEHNAAFATTWTALEDGTADCISATAQGDGESNRDGRVYHIRSVHVKGYMAMSTAEGQAAPTSDELARVALVWDTQTNGAQLTATDVMDGGQSIDVLAFRNLQYSKRFRVLKDSGVKRIQAHPLNEGAINSFAAAPVYVPFKFNVKFKKPIKVRCSGTTAVVTSIADNSLHVIGCATNTNVTLVYQSRVRFCD